jgi:inner membrane protein
MASVFSHPAIALGLGPVFASKGVEARLWVAGAACSVVPDIDVIGFHYGIPYGDLFGHRGITHSLLFAAVLASVLVAAVTRSAAWRGKRLAIGVFLFLCTASHGFFDAMTNGGLGVAFFAPFDGRRYFLPFRPLEVSPIGTHGFFGHRGAAVLETELFWVWLPCLVLGLAATIVRKLHRR